MRITYILEIELQDLAAEKRDKLAEQVGFSTDMLGTAEDVDPTELGDMIAAHIQHSGDELWAGSDMYAEIASVTCAEQVLA